MRVAPVTGRAFGGIGIKGKQAFAFAFIQHHQLRRVGKTFQKSVVDEIFLNQDMQQSHQERTISAGLDGNPLIGNRRVTGAHRVDGDKAPAAAFEFRDGNLHRIAVVVFGRTEHHKHFGAI